MTDSPLNAALRPFESTEANLTKLEKVLSEIMTEIPNGIAFVDENVKFENNCRSFYELLAALPKIDGWRPEIQLMELNEIAQNRLDAEEVGEFEAKVYVESSIVEPTKILREYRYRFDKKRQELIRDALIELIDAVDESLRELSKDLKETTVWNDDVGACQGSCRLIYSADC